MIFHQRNSVQAISYHANLGKNSMTMSIAKKDFLQLTRKYNKNGTASVVWIYSSMLATHRENLVFKSAFVILLTLSSNMSGFAKCRVEIILEALNTCRVLLKMVNSLYYYVVDIVQGLHNPIKLIYM